MDRKNDHEVVKHQPSLSIVSWLIAGFVVWVVMLLVLAVL